MRARLLLLLSLLFATACKEPAAAPPPPRPSAAKNFLGNAADGKLHVYFLDVGQGDSALIVSPEGRTVLVDVGPSAAVNHLVNRLPELLATRLDLVVLTHPAHDHYGALEAVQKIADPRRLLEPQLPETPSDYDGLLTTLGSQGVEIFSPAPNPSQPQELMRLPLGKGVELTILWPRAPSKPLVKYEDAKVAKRAQHEANSIVLRLTYGKTSVLLMGDARAETEALLLKQGVELGSTILKVGAHGADYASTAEFLQKVNPRAAIVSVGTGNAFGMPDPPLLARLQAVRARTFRTDQYGEVHAVSDGTQFVLTTQKLAQGEPPNIQHVLTTEEEDAALVVPSPPPVPAVEPEPVKEVPTKTVSAKGVDSTNPPRIGKVVDIDSLGTPTARGSRTEKKEAPAPRGQKYFASRRRELFHKETCRSVRQISPENLVTFNSREEALKEKKPANDCKP
ncbi:MAG TPA: MBL fold metallo-hydrolase [Hyalangium sp.]|nr:MBL fold metallo-hydrolase [Hyalangium sp.]